MSSGHVHVAPSSVVPAGVVSGVLDEAQEQEDNEAMLAYFFLW
jgi:hypothetical protein